MQRLRHARQSRRWSLLLLFAQLCSSASSNGHSSSAHGEVLPSDDVCASRLRELRGLVARGDFAGFHARALESDHRCHEPYEGHVEIVAKVATPRAKHVQGARSTRTARVIVTRGSADDNGGEDSSLECVSRRGGLCDRSGLYHAKGVILGGQFVVEEARLGELPLKKVSQRLSSDTYVLGTKTLLVIPVCPSDFVGDCSAAFDYELVASEHGGSITSYLNKMVDLADQYLNSSSWSQLSLVPTVTPALRIDYEEADCGTTGDIEYYGTRDAYAYDALAFDAARTAGYDRDDYDFNVVIIPYCDDMSFSGVGWVGVEGSLLNLAATDYDSSFLHELGHNFGAQHASSMMTESSLVAWWDSDSWEWEEYGSPFSTMGAAWVDFTDFNEGQYLVANKMLFDWVPLDKVVTVDCVYVPSSEYVPCEATFELQPTDTSTMKEERYLAVEVVTGTYERFLYMEHRAEHGGVMLFWADFDQTNGAISNTVLVDTDPETWTRSDAILMPGETVLLDLSDEANPGDYPLTVHCLLTDGVISVQLVFSDTSQPTVSPAPSTVAPSLQPTVDQCGDLCCDSIVYSGKNYRKLRSSQDEDFYCCSGHCTYELLDSDDDDGGGWWLQWVAAMSMYYTTQTTQCITSGSWYFIEKFTESTMESIQLCTAEPTTSPTTPQPTVTLQPTAEPTTTQAPTVTQQPTPGPTQQPTAETPGPTAEVTAAPTTSEPTPSPEPTYWPTVSKAPTVTKIPSFVSGSLQFSGLSLEDAVENAGVFRSAIAATVDVDVKTVRLTFQLNERRRLTSSLLLLYEIEAATFAGAAQLAVDLEAQLTTVAMTSALTVAADAAFVSLIVVIDVIDPPVAATASPTTLAPTSESGSSSKKSFAKKNKNLIILGVALVIILALTSLICFCACSCMTQRPREARVAPSAPATNTIPQKPARAPPSAHPFYPPPSYPPQ